MSWILDVIFIVVLLLGIFLGVRAGLVKGLCKLAGTIFSVFVAITFCVPFRNTLDGWFSITESIANGIKNATIASWITIAISFIILVIGVKFLAWLIGKIGTAIVDHVKVFSVINRFLGGILGLLKALIFIFLLLAICRWINIEAVNNFIDSSTIVGAFYNWEWFNEAVRFSFLT